MAKPRTLPRYTVERKSPICISVKINVPSAIGWEQWFLLRSDGHIDSQYSNLAMQRRHMQEAIDKGAGILDFGDLMDAMQGRNDRRAMKSDMKESLKKDHYINELVETGVDFLAPYSQNIVMLATGNHESAIKKYLEYDLTREISRRLNVDHGGQVERAGYRGWVRFQFTINKTRQQSIRLYFNHGSGGSAPVTKGVIKTNRRAVAYPDADIIVSGHTHEAWAVPVSRIRLSESSVEVNDTALHIQVPSYKDALTNQDEGYESEREFMPTPVGAVWLWFRVIERAIVFDAVRAL